MIILFSRTQFLQTQPRKKYWKPWNHFACWVEPALSRQTERTKLTREKPPLDSRRYRLLRKATSVITRLGSRRWSVTQSILGVFIYWTSEQNQSFPLHFNCCRGFLEIPLLTLVESSIINQIIPRKILWCISNRPWTLRGTYFLFWLMWQNKGKHVHADWVLEKH